MTKNDIMKTLHKLQNATLDKKIARLEKEIAETDLSALDRQIAQLQREIILEYSYTIKKGRAGTISTSG